MRLQDSVENQIATLIVYAIRAERGTGLCGLASFCYSIPRIVERGLVFTREPLS